MTENTTIKYCDVQSKCEIHTTHDSDGNIVKSGVVKKDWSRAIEWWRNKQ